MAFEYDGEKSAANKPKHGIDFEEARELWADPARVEIPARVTDEPRWLVIGRIADKALVRSNYAPRREHPRDLGQAFAGRGSGTL